MTLVHQQEPTTLFDIVYDLDQVPWIRKEPTVYPFSIVVASIFSPALT